MKVNTGGDLKLEGFVGKRETRNYARVTKADNVTWKVFYCVK